MALNMTNNMSVRDVSFAPSGLFDAREPISGASRPRLSSHRPFGPWDQKFNTIDVRVAKGTGLSESSPQSQANPPQADCIGNMKINNDRKKDQETVSAI